MPRYDADTAECLVFTFKDGLLSAVAHDLEIRVTDFTVDVDEGPPISVRASFRADSLRAVCAMEGATKRPGKLSAKDLAKIDQNIVKDVLRPGRYPTIDFVSRSIEPDGDGFRLQGDLSLVGRSRPISGRAVADGQRLTLEIPIHQPDFGIKPFTAMMGTLKIQPLVRVRLSLPRPSE